MNIQEFHEKSVSRAAELAKRLGVEFKTPNVGEVQERVTKRLDLLAKYRERKEDYDSVLNKLLDILPADELKSVIQKVLNSSK